MIDFKPISIAAAVEETENPSGMNGHTVRQNIGVEVIMATVDGDEEKKHYPVIIKGNFWDKIIDKDRYGRVVKKCFLNYTEFEDFIVDACFCQMLIEYKDTPNQFQFVQIHDMVVKPTNYKEAKNDILEWTRFNRDKIRDIQNFLMSGAKTFFSEAMFTCLPVKTITFKKDTAKKCFIYFKNCFVEVSVDEKADGEITPHPKHELDAHVWSSQIIDRNYKWDENYMKGDFARFLMLAINKPKEDHYEYPDGIDKPGQLNEKKYYSIYKWPDGQQINEKGEYTEAMQKLLSIMSGIGYMLHGHKRKSQAKMFAMFDALYSREFEALGRTGKSMVFHAIEQIVPTVFIDGKNVDFAKEKETFSSVSIATRVICFNDVKKNFDFTNLFHKITDGITIKRLYQDPLTMTYEDSPKMGLTGNFALYGNDDSSSDRQFIGELDNFFNAKHKPSHYFGRDFWGEEWDEDQWHKFDSFMLRCVAVFLESGFINFPHLNYHFKQLAQTVTPDFIDYMEAVDEENDNERVVKFGIKLAVKDLYENFKKLNGDFDKLTQHKFSIWLKTYCKYYGILINPHIKDGRDRNKGIDYVTLYPAGTWHKKEDAQNELF